jgi:putative ribosome biogenesis GTPase RsgA
MQDSQTASSKIGDYIASIKEVPTRQELLDLLSRNVVNITFDKLSGDERTMKCTLIPELLPPAQREDKLSQTKIRNIEDKVFVVWAIDIDPPAWRSFRYDRIKKVESVDNL